MESVLVVGASGILAPAASGLVARGARVTGISRSRPVPRGVVPLHVDAHDLRELDRALAESRWDAALVYEPAVSAETLRRVGAAVDGRTVLVCPSGAADPALGEPAPVRDTLLLGWTRDASGVRWHTPQEVSDAALDVLDDGAFRMLGVVRPWEDRP